MILYPNKFTEKIKKIKIDEQLGTGQDQKIKPQGAPTPTASSRLGGQ